MWVFHVDQMMAASFGVRPGVRTEEGYRRILKGALNEEGECNCYETDNR